MCMDDYHNYRLCIRSHILHLSAKSIRNIPYLYTENLILILQTFLPRIQDSVFLLRTRPTDYCLQDLHLSVRKVDNPLTRQRSHPPLELLSCWKGVGIGPSPLKVGNQPSMSHHHSYNVVLSTILQSGPGGPTPKSVANLSTLLGLLLQAYPVQTLERHPLDA